MAPEPDVAAVARFDVENYLKNYLIHDDDGGNSDDGDGVDGVELVPRHPGWTQRTTRPEAVRWRNRLVEVVVRRWTTLPRWPFRCQRS
jgi:hypothetical protein